MTSDQHKEHWARQIGKFWALHDNLRVSDAAALIAGIEPSVVEWEVPPPRHDMPTATYVRNEDGIRDEEGVQDINTALSALVNAIKADKLPAAVRHSAREYGDAEREADFEYQEIGVVAPGVRGTTREEDEEFSLSGGCFYNPFPDWFLTTVQREDLVAWLDSRGFPVPFFGVDDQREPSYLDPNHSRFSPKLAAAVRAWLALEDEEQWRGQHPKTAVMKWLETRYKELGLTVKDSETGKIKKNQTGIEQAAAVVNWKPQGGSPKTPAGE